MSVSSPTGPERSTVYSHTQRAWPVRIVVGAVTLIIAWIAVTSFVAGGMAPLVVISGAVALGGLVVLTFFSALTVCVDDERITLRFGPGIIGKRFRLTDVASSGVVRTRWWHGWGIRWVPGIGWLYNVTGLDAVELQMRSGERYRIGTDEPAKLRAAIEAARGAG